MTPKKMVIVEHFNFGESIATYVAELQRLTTDSAFSNHLDKAQSCLWAVERNNSTTSFSREGFDIYQGYENTPRHGMEQQHQLFKNNGGAINMQTGSRRLMQWVSQRNPINPVTPVGRVITQPHNVN